MEKPKNTFKRDDVGQDLRRSSRARRETLAELASIERPQTSVRNDLVPLATLEYVPLGQLKSPKRSVRRRMATQIARVRESMRVLGAAAPAIISHDNEVIDGETRLAAAAELGLEVYPCFRLPGSYSDEDIRLLRITLNRTQELGQFELPDLKIELQELRGMGAPIEITGFTLPEIDQLCLDELDETPEPARLEPDRSRTSHVHPGDIYALGPHRVACGDARDPNVLTRLFKDDPKAALVLTDVPYNLRVAGLVTSGDHAEFAMASGEMSREEFAQFNADWMATALTQLKDGGLLASFIDWRSVEILLAEGRGLGLTLLNIIVWVKSNAGQGSLWRSQHELLPVFKLGTAPHVNNVELGRHGRWRSNAWNYPGASSLGSDARDGLKLHPTVKSLHMLEDALLDVTLAGDIVLDVFLGSGSTLLAAEKTGRVCRAIEIEPHYVELAVRRWMSATGQPARLLETGETLDAVMTRRSGEFVDDPPPPTKPRVRVPARQSQEAGR